MVFVKSRCLEDISFESLSSTCCDPKPTVLHFLTAAVFCRLWDGNCDFPRQPFPLLLFLLFPRPSVRSPEEMWEKRLGKMEKRG